MQTVTDAEGNAIVLTDSNGSNLYPNYAQSLTYSDGTLYWAYYTQSWRGTSSELISIDVETMTAQNNVYASMAYDVNGELVEYYPMTEIVGLYTLTDTEYEIPAAEALESLWMSGEHLVLNVDDTAKVKANLIPWNYELTDLTWTSSDESVATVDAAGNITAVSEGNAVITAASGDISTACAVTVVDVDGNFYAYNYYSADGNDGYMIDVDMGSMNYSLTAEAPADFYAADFNGHDGYYYGYTEGGQLWRADLETGEAVKLGDPIGAVPSDMAYDYSTGLMHAVTIDFNWGCSCINAVNLNNGQLMPLVEVYDLLLTLACDMDGTVYGIGMYGDLHQIDMTTGEDLIVLSGLGQLQYMQSMCYDHENDVILWAYPEYSQLFWIDVKNENPYAVSLGDPTGSGLFEFVGMYTIPAVIPALKDVAVEEVSAADMLILSGVEKMPNITILPFNATCQTAQMTSSDETVVQVTENGALLGVAAGEADITFTLTDSVGGQTFEGSFQVTVLEPADDVYGHVMTDLASMGGQYWVRLYAVDPGNPDILEATEYIIYAEEQVNGKLYAYGYDPNDWTGNWQLFIMDSKTHAVERQLSMGEGFPFVYDLTYDYATSTMYAVAGPSDNASNVYVVDMETGELTEHFRTSLSQCKPDIDLMFVSGVNHTYFHGTTYSPAEAPWPGWKFYATVDMSPTNSIWRDAPAFFQYITRCQSFLQAGKPDNDFLVYLPVYDLWQEQDGRLLMFDIHKMAKRAPRFIEAVHRINDAGYDMDYISDNFIRTAKVAGGKIVTSGGTAYKALVIPGARLMPADVLEKLMNLAKEGATVVFLDQYPEDVPGYARLKERRAEFNRILGDVRKMGSTPGTAGRVIFGTDYAGTLAQTMAVPEAMKTGFGLSCIRRAHAEGAHYFISALTAEDTEAWIPLAVSARSAMLYNPMDGTSGKARIRRKDGKTEVFLQLASGESVLLKTFAEVDVQAPAWRYYTPCATPENDLAWNKVPDRRWGFRWVESIPAVGNVPDSISLGSWTDLSFEGAETAMGTGGYTTTFVVENPAAAEDWLLSLGDVRESARVRINGREVATLWAVPYRCFIGPYLRPGKNTLEVEVTNLPANRIADMDRRGVKWRIFKDINMAALGYKKGTYAGWQPVPSGLLGPVRIVPVRTIKE